MTKVPNTTRNQQLPKTRKLARGQLEKLILFVNVVCVNRPPPYNIVWGNTFHWTFYDTEILRITIFPTYAIMMLNSGGFRTMGTLLSLTQILQGSNLTVLTLASSFKSWLLCENGIGEIFVDGMTRKISVEQALKIINSDPKNKFHSNLDSFPRVLTRDIGKQNEK